MRIRKTVNSTLTLTERADALLRSGKRALESAQVDRKRMHGDQRHCERAAGSRALREPIWSWRTTVSTEALLLSPVLRRLFALVAVVIVVIASTAYGATFQSDNFIVKANDADFARLVAEYAEEYRDQLSNLWLGATMRNWAEPCVITVVEGENVAASGETVYTFARGEVFDWKMRVQGTRARILDSVLPHEITHTILASYLRAPAPRWIDEGMATSVEADSERSGYRNMLVSFLYDRRGISFNDMVAMKEYPKDLTPFYSQAFSVCEYLILIGGHRRLVEFAKYGLERNDWNLALREYYDCKSLGDLQTEWNDWIRNWTNARQTATLPPTRKMPHFDRPIIPDSMIAHTDVNTPTIASAPISRSSTNVASRDLVTRGQTRVEEKGGLFPNLPRLFAGRNVSTSETPQRERSALETPQSLNRSVPSGRVSSLSVLANGAGTATRVQTHDNVAPKYYSPLPGRAGL